MTNNSSSLLVIPVRLPLLSQNVTVWISLDENHEIVDFLEYTANLEASVAMWFKMSFTKEFKMAITLLNIPVLGCTCLSTL
jgi:hypothetical protein